MYDLYLAVEAGTLAGIDVANAMTETMEAVIKRAANKYLASIFLHTSDSRNPIHSSGNWSTSKSSGKISTQRQLKGPYRF